MNGGLVPPFSRKTMEKKKKETTIQKETPIQQEIAKPEVSLEELRKQVADLQRENTELMKKMLEEKKAPIQPQKQQQKNTLKGIFHWHEVPQGTMSFLLKTKRGENVKKYSLVDGQEYNLPIDVVCHLNDSGKYPVHRYTTGADGKPHQGIGKMQKRFSYEITEFLDLSDKNNLKAMGSKIDVIMPLDRKKLI